MFKSVDVCVCVCCVCVCVVCGCVLCVCVCTRGKGLAKVIQGSSHTGDRLP